MAFGIGNGLQAVLPRVSEGGFVEAAVRTTHRFAAAADPHGGSAPASGLGQTHRDVHHSVRRSLAHHEKEKVVIEKGEREKNQ